MKSHRITTLASIACLVLSTSGLLAHGDVTPQSVDTADLPPLGTSWLEQNPYRGNDKAVVDKAIEIGSKGYNSNCARCHGLDVKSGGMAPDLRYLEASPDGDKWFMNRIRHGAVVGGRQKMPPFEGILSQEAIWAIRTYIESRPQD